LSFSKLLFPNIPAQVSSNHAKHTLHPIHSPLELQNSSPQPEHGVVSSFFSLIALFSFGAFGRGNSLLLSSLDVLLRFFTGVSFLTFSLFWRFCFLVVSLYNSLVVFFSFWSSSSVLFSGFFILFFSSCLLPYLLSQLPRAEVQLGVLNLLTL